MATNYLEEEQMETDLDVNSVNALTALAAGGQEGLDAYKDAQDSADAIRVAAQKDYETLINEGAAPEALLGELMADRDVVMSGVDTARQLRKEGFETGIAGIESALQGYTETFKSQAPTYEKMGKQIITDAANKRAAAAAAAREKRLKEARNLLFRSLELQDQLGEDLYNSVTNVIPATRAAIEQLPAPPEIKEILYELTNPQNPEMTAWAAHALIGSVSTLAPYRGYGGEFISAYLDMNYPQVDPSSVISYLTSINVPWQDANTTAEKQRGNEDPTTGSPTDPATGFPTLR